MVLEAQYASHMPVLEAICKHFEIRRVLELGAGLYSTKLFLDFSRLEKLVSIENDPEWARKARTPDPRHEMRLVQGAVADHVPPLDEFQLVFIDDSTRAVDRARTIRTVLSQPHPLVVVHDAEVSEYAAVIAEFSLVPATAVIL